MNAGFDDGAVAWTTSDDDFQTERPSEPIAAVDARDRERWSALDSLPSQVMVLDPKGTVRWVNSAWTRNALDRQGRSLEAVGAGFLHLCATSMGYSRESLTRVATGMRAVLAGTTAVFEFEHACHPAGCETWHLVTITPCAIDGERGALVQHADVTDLRQADRRRSIARAVARAMAREDARREMLRDVITHVCDALGWSLAAHWSWDRGHGVLRCDNAYGPRTVSSRGWATLRNVEGLASRVWSAHAPQWSAEVDPEDAAVARAALGARSTEIVEAVGIPVGRDGRADGVVVFYSAHGHRPDAALVNMLSALLVGATWAPEASASPASFVVALAGLETRVANDVAPARPARRARVTPTAPACPAPAALPEVCAPSDLTLDAVERAHIERVLVQCGFNMRRAATALGISRSTLYIRARHYKLLVTRPYRKGRVEAELEGGDNVVEVSL